MSSKAEEEKDEFQGGELLICGGVNWDITGRKKEVEYPEGYSKEYFELLGPHRIKGFTTIKIKKIATAASACHSVAISDSGSVYTWGRNEQGQLGHGDLTRRDAPTTVGALKTHQIVDAAMGRSHTIFITSNGVAMSCGLNKGGQLGLGSVSDRVMTPSAIKLSSGVRLTAVACGAEFSVLLDEANQVWTFGHPEHGVLGHGTDNQFVATNKFMFTPQPTPRAVMGLLGRRIVKIACGNVHSAVADDQNNIFTWGFGGYGRLGHGDTVDLKTPKQIKPFTRGPMPAILQLSCGASMSAVALATRELYMWGQVKKTGDSWLYPRPNNDLAGWQIRSVSLGNSHSMVSADSSVISWGQATYGELGYGPTGPKSSANPRKVDSLEGFIVPRVGTGYGHTLFLVDRSDSAALDKFPSYTPPPPGTFVAQESDDENEEAGNGKAKGNANKGKRKAKPAPAKGKASSAATNGPAAGKSKKAKK